MSTGVGRAPTVEQLLAAKEIAVCCGSGGVGKTTTAAAMAAMSAVALGSKTLVITVDPARRLADALGMDGLGNVERKIEPSAFKEAGVEPRGELWAAMLDTKQSWDELVQRHAPDRATAERILNNRLYENVAGRFVQSHEYIAMERLYDAHASGRYDLIVVDTPPTRSAVDFLRAPDRMAEFFASKLLRWLTAPSRSRMLNLASRPFYQVADRLLGSQFLEDVSEFFLLFQSMYAGFAQRAASVKRLLHDRRTTFVVVSTLEAAPLREAEDFLAVLVREGFHPGALVLNKVLPPYLLDPALGAVAERLAANAPALGQLVAEDAEPTSPATVARVLREVAESFLNFSVVAKREAEQRAELGTVPDVVASVPYFDQDICDLRGLLALGRTVWGG
ncbi:MAG: AAA family ATPase [Actinomycetota bacterium]|nr:AAA family ATPase [Actinomycetota bacterium]